MKTGSSLLLGLAVIGGIGAFVLFIRPTMKMMKRCPTCKWFFEKNTPEGSAACLLCKTTGPSDLPF